MGCIVDKILLESGKPSELFKDLLGNLSQERALRTYLEIKSNEEAYKNLYGVNNQGEVNSSNFLSTPKFKLAEFTSYQQQADTMDFLATTFIRVLQQMPGVASTSSLAGVNLGKLVKDPTVVPKAIELTRQTILTELAIAGNKVAKPQQALRIQAVKNLPAYLQTVVNGVPSLGPLGYALADYGIAFKIHKTSTFVEQTTDEMAEVDEGVDVERKERQYERIYDMDLLESSVSNTILNSVRLYIKNKRRVADKYKHKAGEPVSYYTSELGHHSPIQYEQTVGKLFAILKGVQSPTEMVKRLENAIPRSPELVPIYLDLKKEESSPTIVRINNKDTNYKPIATALFSAFAKQDYNMFTIAEDKGQVVFYASNASSVQKNLQTRWAEGLLRYKESPVEHKGKVIEAINNFRNNKESVANLNRLHAPELRRAALLFQSVGFSDIDGEDIKALIAYVKANKNKFSDSIGSTNHSIVDFFIKTLVIGGSKGEDVFNTKKAKSKNTTEDVSKQDQFGENRNISALSEVVSHKINDISLNAFYSGRGTMVHPINLASEGQDIWNRLDNSDTMEMFASDPLYEANTIIKVYESAIHKQMFNVATMDVLNDNSKTASGVQYGDLSSFDAIMSKVNGYFGGIQNPKYFYAFSPTLGDRGKTQALILPKLDYEIVPTSLFDKKGQMKEGQIREWVRETIQGEILRIQSVSSDSVKFKNYTENGKKFMVFPELNNVEEFKNLIVPSEQQALNALVDKVTEYVVGSGSIFKATIEGDISFMIENGVITENGNGTFSIPKAHKKNAVEGLRKTAISKAQIENFLSNNFISNHDQSLMYLGDLAYYSSKSDAALKADLNKRFALPFTPGIKLATGEGHGLPATSRIKIIEEGIVGAELQEFYKSLIPKNPDGKNPYAAIELADGTGFLSLSRYRELLLAQGLHTDEMLSFIDAQLAWKPGDVTPEGDVQLEVLKLFYFRLQKGDHGRVAPFNLKYAAMPVLPAYYEQKVNGEYRFPAMAAISQELRSNRADEVVMPSAVKAGGVYIGNIKDIQKTKTTVIYNDSVRIPQVAVNKDNIEDRFGSQTRKLIIANFNHAGKLTLNNEEVGASVALKAYNDAISSIVSSASDQLYNEFLTGGKVNEPQLVAKLLNELESNPHNNVDYYKQALTTFNEAGERMLPLNYPTIKYKVDSLINAAFRNRVNRVKLPGHSAVQVTNFGTEALKNQLSVGGDLKYTRFEGVSEQRSIALMDAYRKGDKDALKGIKVTPAEVRVTPRFFNGTLLTIAEKNVNTKEALKNFDKNIQVVLDQKKGAAPEEITRIKKEYRSILINAEIKKEYNRLKAQITDSKGQFDVAKIKALGLDEVVLYRIPTQGRNSMMIATIKEFLPLESGSTIQLPAEYIAQSGSDFDIDKVFIEMSAFKKNPSGVLEKVSYGIDNGKPVFKSNDEAKSYIIDFHKSVLSSPDYLVDMLSPNGSPTLAALATQYGYTDDAMSSNWNSLATQEVFRSNNAAGDIMISISSLTSVAHSNALHIGAQFMKPAVINGKTIDLQKTYSYGEGGLDSTTKIAKEIEEIQTASVDNAKDPLLGKLNINEITSDAVLLLIAAGYGLEYATTIVNAPIVRMYAKTYPKFTRSNSDSQAHSKTLKEIKKLLNIDRRDLKAQGYVKPSIAKHTLADATKLLTPTTISDHQAALDVFLAVTDLGKGLSSFNTTMNIDSKGTPSTVAGLLSIYFKLAKIVGTATQLRESKAPKKTSTILDTVYRTPTELLSTLQTEAKKVVLSDDKKKYIHSEKVGNKVVNTELKRMSDYLGNTITPSKFIDAANKAGTTVDKVVRDFFINGKVSEVQSISPTAIAHLTKKLTELKEYFKSKGQTVITDANELKVFDLALGVAGEMDLLTVDKKGQVRIYDMKTEKNSNAADIMRNRPKTTKEQADAEILERFNKRGKQLNGYRGVLRNMLGVSAVELHIIPINISYNEDGSYINTVKTPAGLLDGHFENHDIVENAIPDTREKVTVDNESMYITFKKKVPTKFSPVMVTDFKYKESHLHQMEINSVHSPLSVNRKISASASIQMQKILSSANDAIGNLSEKQQVKLFTDYDTFLALNSSAVRTFKSTLSRRVATNAQLQMTDKTNIKSTGNLILEYRRRIEEDRSRGGTSQENGFIQNLSTITEGGKIFVTMNNVVAKGLSASGKRDMMFFYEDLMNAPKGSIEETLARELADYAVIHYGFSRGFNSFMEFLPPAAHNKYMGSTTGETGFNLPNFFREVYKNLDNTTIFNDPEVFLDLFVQNNAHTLPITRVFVNPLESIEPWQQVLIEEAEQQETDPAKYVLVSEMGITSLHKFIQNRGYTNIGFKGIPHYAIEYRVGESLYNDTVGSTSGESAKAKATTEQKAGIAEWESIDSAMSVFNKAGLTTTTFKSTEDITKFTEKVVDLVNKNKDLTPADKKVVEQTLDDFKVMTMGAYKSALRKNKDINLDSVVKENLKDAVELTIFPNQVLLKKLKYC